MWAGEPAPFSNFDPNVTPHEFVLAGRSLSDGEARDRFVRSSLSMADDVEASGADRWNALGVSPLGLVPWWWSVMHIFWDSWLHERDIFLPLGSGAPEVEDELRAVVTYAVLLAGTTIRDEEELSLVGVRLRTGARWSASPPSGVLAEDAPKVVDALGGRGDLLDVLATDVELAEKMSTLGRRLSG